jgi:hypothetical protein
MKVIEETIFLFQNIKKLISISKNWNRDGSICLENTTIQLAKKYNKNNELAMFVLKYICGTTEQNILIEPKDHNEALIILDAAINFLSE